MVDSKEIVLAVEIAENDERQLEERTGEVESDQSNEENVKRCSQLAVSVEDFEQNRVEEDTAGE